MFQDPKENKSFSAEDRLLAEDQCHKCVKKTLFPAFYQTPLRGLCTRGEYYISLSNKRHQPWEAPQYLWGKLGKE